MNRTALIMTGGTGGHIFPALAVADELRQRGWTVVFLGAEGGMETRLVPDRGYPLKTLAIRGVRGNGVRRWLLMPLMLARAVLKSLALQFGVRPDVVVGFGGYTGAPGGLAARLLWKPLVIHEQNSVAGLTNRVLSHIATRTLFAFPGAFAGKAGLVGNPVRADIAALPAPESRFAGRSGPLRLLVVGGSLGARVFNEVVPEALARLPAAERPVVVQQAGAKQLDALRDNYARAGVTADCRAFIDDMAAEYAAADLVLCRAGALTVAELAAAGVASVLVPFPHAVDDHQTGNAAFLADAGAGILLSQSGLTAESLAALLADMTRDRCLEMAVTARRQARTDAASRVADVCEELAE
ncbi:undecaprenyldiphospho-muramoylpentapeptide beta-N-acetylglucosaminyltransferase [Laribacter hongkongensis]|uniref:undecaprenyldiphospho-muramoylpentapeptide beta-N-acetylglucosaminyltransferase n=1 Tax=Laribacter hongkongensis TaxID=168471 RepID=UPI001EFE2484|nr:undecaprenyldiphospho-muramoylpentapeptide beta-N-acetylglucosaminyltransferase [Laribacter hongkongensis]MCG9031678.1 undecaprenyldiphospho-muramoylpentapeptide beta-N-acetylglucosaminyltransferase [Laribacter hongkongensis]MCG9091471.1 undecaprenyldiphospho-muramoylpentapeptide beta-N-acetylglucosaminyltransferase [Laribacter hongkongensis]